MIVQTHFALLLKEIEPAPEHKHAAVATYKKLQEYIRDHPELGSLVQRVHLIGSYAKGTAIRPRPSDKGLEKPVIDVMVVLNHSLFVPPQVILDQLCEVLKPEFPLHLKRSRSILIAGDEGIADVIPAVSPLEEKNVLFVPDRNADKWWEFDQQKHTAWVNEIHKASRGQFRPLVRLFKWWCRENLAPGSSPNGFILECITAECMDYQEAYYGEQLAVMMGNIVERYLPAFNQGKVPVISDPSMPGRNVAEYMSFEEFQEFYELIKEHAEIARTAVREPDLKKTIKLWRRVMGQRFPVDEYPRFNNPPVDDDLSGLSFPDRPVIPRKPGEFN